MTAASVPRPPLRWFGESRAQTVSETDEVVA